jgi:ferritin-like metal-binding protein YciE
MTQFYRLFIEELKDIYSAEKQIAKAMPNLIRAAKHPELKKALSEHLKETKKQITRLEKAAKELKESFAKASCVAMQGILKEGSKVLKAHYQKDTQDAAIISCAQRVEHYEIAVYGVLKTFAKHLKLTKIAKWLNESLQEEGSADKKLTKIAEGNLFIAGVNTNACQPD